MGKNARSRSGISRNWPQMIKAHWAGFVSLQGNPHYVALGTAIGVFISMMPIFPFQLVTSIALAIVLRVSKPAAAIAVWLGNPLTLPLFYFGSYQLGTKLLGHETQAVDHPMAIGQLVAAGWDLAAAMLAGGAILGLVPALLSYVGAYYLFSKLQARRINKASYSERTIT